MAGGRPTKFNQALAERICTGLAAGSSLRKLCLADDMPNASTVHRWLDADDEFCKQYARACERRAESIIDEAYEIADDGRNDTYQLDDGSKKVEHDHIQRSRLRVDLRKWDAARLNPKKYGDKVRQEISGADGSPVKFIVEIVEAKK